MSGRKPATTRHVHTLRRTGAGPLSGPRRLRQHLRRHARLHGRPHAGQPGPAVDRRTRSGLHAGPGCRPRPPAGRRRRHSRGADRPRRRSDLPRPWPGGDYLLIDLRRNKPGGKLYARQFVHKIEQAIINVLTAYNLAGERIAGAPGIYLAEGAKKGAKIAALGLKVRGNGCTYHGLSLNVAMDLAPFSWINPCGYAGLETVDMRSMGVSAPLADVQQALAQELLRLLYEVPVPEPMLTP